MSSQLDIFHENYRKQFYKGHREMWAKRLEAQKPSDEMIYIYPLKQKENEKCNDNR